jgi:hypothetical protein
MSHDPAQSKADVPSGGRGDAAPAHDLHADSERHITPQEAALSVPGEIQRAGPERSRRLVWLASPCSLVAASWRVLGIREITAW